MPPIKAATIRNTIEALIKQQRMIYDAARIMRALKDDPDAFEAWDDLRDWLDTYDNEQGKDK